MASYHHMKQSELASALNGQTLINSKSPLHHMTAQKALHWLLPMAEISATTKVSIVLNGHNCR